jgi:phosphoesterase RecJ-like protein
MGMDEALLRLAGKQLREADHIVVLSHQRPDGDAVGSVLGLGLALQGVGKEVQMVLADGVPRNLRHLPGADLVQQRVTRAVDLWVVLDCSDLDRVGDVTPEAWEPDINLDHHVTNLNFASLNLVDTHAVATAAILADSFPIWGLALTPSIAANLLTGLLTDTLGFRTGNMNADALRIGADLMEAGADLSDLYYYALVVRSFDGMRMWGQGLSKLQRRGRLVWTELTRKDREIAGYPGRDDGSLINVLSAIKDYDVALIFVEQPAGQIKVSWRAVPGLDVSQVAFRFGGGGHPAAAGAMVKGSLASVQKKVLAATEQILAKPIPGP